MTKILTLLTVLLLMSGCSAFTEHSTGLTADRSQLTVCPSWPRCVSSDSPRVERYVAPLALSAEGIAMGQHLWPKVVETVRAIERARIVENTENYLHAEIDSPWDFYIDDLELHWRPEAKTIAVRSSGRIGYYDFEVNRKRVEALRNALIDQGLVKATQVECGSSMLRR